MSTSFLLSSIQQLSCSSDKYSSSEVSDLRPFRSSGFLPFLIRAARLSVGSGEGFGACFAGDFFIVLACGVDLPFFGEVFRLLGVAFRLDTDFGLPFSGLSSVAS